VVVIGDVEIRRDSPVAEVLLAYVSEQVRVIKEQEHFIRQGQSDSVHQMRVAMRRLRSVLATYAALLDIDLVDHLRVELKWLGLILGAERDAEVMRHRLMELISSEPTEVDFESPTHQLNEKLTANISAAHVEVLRTIDNERYSQLLNDLGALLIEPPLTCFARRPVKKIVPNLIVRDWKRLRRTVADLNEIPVDRDSALHEVRKSAKRLRYAAETAELARYKGARKLASAAARVQTSLGDYRDSILASDFLLNIREQNVARDGSDFFLAHLLAREECHAEQSEIQFRKAWKRFPSGSLH
jgi:CHAD domain-containing protein